MSASREKKTRQELSGQELTEKQLKARKEEQRAKRNRIVYTVLGVVCAVLVAALLIWDSGFFQGRAAALTIDGKSYTATELQYYYRNVYSRYYTYAQYGLVSGLDVNKAPQDQVYNTETGQTWRDLMIDEAVTSMTEVEALANKAQAEGYTLSDEGKASVQSQIDQIKASSAANGYTSINSYLKGVYGKTMDQRTFEQLITRSVLASEYETHYSETLSYTDEQIETYYTENADARDLFSYSYALFNGTADSTKDADGNTVDPTEAEQTAALNAAKEKAEALQSALRSGTAFDKATEGYSEDGKVTLYADQSTAGSSLGSAYAEWLQDAGRKKGDVTLIENSGGNGYYVVQFESRGRDTECTANVRHVLVAAEQDTGATEPTEAQYAAAKEKAEKLLADWKAGGATEDAFAQMAADNSADTGSASNGGLLTVSAKSGYMEGFTNWALDSTRQSGDTGLVQNTGSSTKGWHIMYFVERNDETWKESARTALLNGDMSEWLTGLTDAQTVVRESGLQYVK